MNILNPYTFVLDKIRQARVKRREKREQKRLKNIKYYRESYAQCGEDLVLNHLLFEYFELENFSYLDIGSAHPLKINNTYFFYKKGFRGVCVDANPALTELYKKERPEDLFINSGVITEDDTEQDFYVLNAPELNTFDSKEAERVVAEHGFQIEKVIKMRTMNINSIIKKYCQSPPELISIDIEGLDFAVLKSIDYDTYRPKIIIVEMASYGKLKENESKEMAKFMEKKRYDWWGNVGYSSIFIDDVL